ncbi:cell division protein FstK [Acinetobacter sp. Ac_877]|uniref:DNA translocase FtsK n=1 Tax=Acinetobacter portensis TaxID=1839785 RepID=UPI00128BF910|nr:DNA translocase FtsK [Acinetobacter portensis]MPW41338.1 cell division protein FstK [Acinetobacter portensis]
MTAVSGAYAQRFIITLFLISFGIYLFLATVTYTPFDPGWMHVSSDTQTVSNASGVVGAWFADLLFGFLGWASVLIPLYFFIEAIQLWWPRSFLNKPFRYAAQFFILLSTSSILYLFWNVPADTLENASGGIIGYELGQSLSSLLTIYGASVFLIVFWVVLFTLAFGIQWNKTWSTMKATPAYLQDLFYRNVPEADSSFSHAPIQADKVVAKSSPITNSVQSEPLINTKTAVEQSPVDDHIANRLFADMVDREEREYQVQNEKQSNIQFDKDDELEFEIELEKAHQLEQESSKVVETGEVWRAIHDDSEQKHKNDINELLKASQDSRQAYDSSVNGQEQTYSQTSTKQNINWDDDEIFDELLAAVPNNKTATDVHTPFNHVDHSAAEHSVADGVIHSIATTVAPTLAAQTASTVAMTAASTNIVLDDFDHLDDFLLDESKEVETTEVKSTSSYAQSSPFVKAQIQTDFQPVAPLVSEDEKELVSSNKDAFREAWQGTTGGAVEDELDVKEDDFDLDAPLTDAFGRPMSRAMQVAAKRRDLPTLPGLDILDKVDPNKKVNFTAEQLARLSELLEIKLQEFNVKAKVIEAQPGPVVTRFELDLAPGVKASKVTNISRDLARSMSMASVRVVEVIPGKPYIGIEVPNSTREMVRLIELLETPAYRDPNALLSMAMGKDISGNPVLADLAKAPHMLVAGTTGSGKSVAVNAMLLSMLLKYTPEQLRLIMIDPKQLELANYNDIPHLLTPVVTDMKDAVNALNWCVNEMERRYKLMSLLKVRKLTDYNRKVEEAIANGEDLIDPTWKPDDTATINRAPRLQPMPLIVIVADEFADMIMQVGKKAEEMITRLAQKSRAAGIHLLLATQRPTVDVVTGLIKANIPTRAALRVNSKLDSRTILDAGGAEDLLGHGDMLFLGPGKIEPERVHGAFISDDEVNRICDAWRERGDPNYVDEILTPYDEDTSSRGYEDGEGGSDRDALYDQCVSFVLETRKASTSSLQRKFSLGYNRAARIIDQMEESGIVSAMGPNGKRDILV